MKKILLVMFTLICVTGAYAQKPAVVTDKAAGWQKIGETKASFETDRDELVVLGADRFKSIRLHVTDASLNLLDLEVYYETGDKEDIAVRQEIRAGGETRVIDLKGKDRELKKVVFIYKTVPNSAKDKAKVELWGLK